MTITRRKTAALTAAAFVSVSLVTPADAARSGTRINLTSTGCTFVVSASWTRLDVTEVVLRLSKKEGRFIKENAQLASTDLTARTARATWVLSGENARLGDFSASAYLYGTGGAAGTALEQRASITKIRAACALQNN